MDCKNCPNGASQPNPMDDSMFEKSIAMLHNWVMLEAIREDHPKERIVMVILPGAGGELLTEAGSRDIFEDVYDEMEADLVADGELLLHYDKSDVIETDRTRYLLGAAEVSEIDQNGNECSINLFTLERTIDYVNENLTVQTIIRWLAQFDGDFILQTCFLRGEHNGQLIDNTTPEELAAWYEAVETLHPKQIMMYVIDRKTPEEHLSKISREEMEAIAAPLKVKGFKVSISA